MFAVTPVNFLDHAFAAIAARQIEVDVATGEATAVALPGLNVWEFDWHGGDVAALVAVFVICTGLSAKVFRWE